MLQSFKVLITIIYLKYLVVDRLVKKHAREFLVSPDTFGKHIKSRRA